MVSTRIKNSSQERGRGVRNKITSQAKGKKTQTRTGSAGATIRSNRKGKTSAKKSPVSGKGGTKAGIQRQSVKTQTKAKRRGKMADGKKSENTKKVVKRTRPNKNGVKTGDTDPATSEEEPAGLLSEIFLMEPGSHSSPEMDNLIVRKVSLLRRIDDFRKRLDPISVKHKEHKKMWRAYLRDRRALTKEQKRLRAVKRDFDKSCKELEVECKECDADLSEIEQEMAAIVQEYQQLTAEPISKGNQSESDKKEQSSKGKVKAIKEEDFKQPGSLAHCLGEFKEMCRDIKQELKCDTAE